MNPEHCSSWARQWELEALAAKRGAERLRHRTARDEQREYGSGTLWGRKLVNQQVAAIATKIRATQDRLTRGKAYMGGVHLHDVLQHIEPEVMAAIAAKKAIDLIAMGRDEKGSYRNTYTNVCVCIGKAIEAEARFRWYEQTAPEEFKRIRARYFLPTTGTHQKETVAKVMMNRRGFKWDQWSQPKRHQIGAFLLDCIATTVKWFQFKVSNLKGKKNALRLVVMSDELTDLKSTIMQLAELQAPLTWPMVCEPAPWSNTERGGYLTNELRTCFSLVRGQRCPLTLGNTPIDMLNTLQSVAYKVNPVTYRLMKHLERVERTLGSFVLQSNELPIPKPDTEDKDKLFEWRKARADQENRNASLKGRRYRTLETLQVADMFCNEPVLYIPWSFCYRGRCYPLVTFMSPQGTDMEKSLFLFAKERPVTERAKFWLAVHLANTAGKDKLSLEDRVAWTQAHHPLISAIATNPEEHLAQLEGFDSPWCGLAACAEYHACVITGEKTTTDLPVATDATCSGLQHLAAMTMDATSGALVNLSPTPAPADAYRAVLDKTVALLEGPHPELAQWAQEVGRSLSKRVTMTVCYAATPHSNRGYIRKALLEHERETGRHRKPTAEELSIFTRTMLQALAQVIPGPIAVMEWIKASVKDYILAGHEELIWISPSGFAVRQDKRKLSMVKVRTQLLGDVISSSVSSGYGETDISKHCHATAPNFIHSADSALLHNSFAGYDQPFMLIHDSILTSAADMDYMSEVIRDEFVKIYETKPLQSLAHVLKAEIPDGMVVGDLDLSKCRSSVYFFC
jgi:DNA-directed RNA polymerase